MCLKSVVGPEKVTENKMNMTHDHLNLYPRFFEYQERPLEYWFNKNIGFWNRWQNPINQ